eukprot:998317-Pelagomonas_calceolata.AAC.7
MQCMKGCTSQHGRTDTAVMLKLPCQNVEGLKHVSTRASIWAGKRWSFRRAQHAGRKLRNGGKHNMQKILSTTTVCRKNRD